MAVKLEYGQACRRPIARYDFNRAAARQESASVVLDSRRHLLQKLRIQAGVENLNICNDVCRQSGSPSLKSGCIWVARRFYHGPGIAPFTRSVARVPKLHVAKGAATDEGGGGRLRSCPYFASSEPSMSVQITLAVPPQPFTRAMSFFSTWRSPASPMIWRAASTT